ncbi:MAG: hypothetical protein GXZ19_03540 [Bacteroidales bacterium]|nr:hypothetical protein [Clostridiaceae bacterium]NLX65838.1 hypothetical protein [Bacteroidales bacterium]
MRPTGADFEAEEKFKVRRIYVQRGHSPAGQGDFGLPERLPCSFDGRKKIKERELLCFLNGRQR